MLIKDAGNRFDEYAYRIGTREIADPTAVLEEGSWVSLDDAGKVVSADGTKLAFLNLTSNRTGRDNVSTQAMWPKATYLMGQMELTVQNSDLGDTTFDSTATYGYLVPLVVKADSTTGQGVLTPATTLEYEANTTSGVVTVTGNTPDQIVAYSMGPADAVAKTLRICVR